jgi:hypothetical protein
MSAQQSNLSFSSYNYDVVVATSQASINNNLVDLFYESIDPETGENKLAPMVVKYYGLDENGNTYEMDEATVLSQTGNLSPFDVADWQGGTPIPADVNTIYNSDFYMGFKAQLGVDPAWTDTYTTIVGIDPNTQAVTYNMVCSSFQIVEATFGKKGIVKYTNGTQSEDAPWVFTATVPLTNINNADNLPTDVQKALDNLGGEFSVQKLLLDIDNAALQDTPEITQFDAGAPVLAALKDVFMGEYFAAIKKNGQPVLNYSIVIPSGTPSSLNITEVELYAGAFVGTNGLPVTTTSTDQKNIQTLNYLCGTNGHLLKVPTQFNWNWLDDNQTDINAFDGIISVNRNTFAQYFLTELLPTVMTNCYLSHVTVTYDASSTKTNYNMELTSGQTPTTTINPSGSTVLNMHYSSTSSDQAGPGGIDGSMTLTSTMDVTVDFSGKDVTITQHLVIYAKIDHLSDSADGNVVDTTITDVYAVSATDDGKLLFAKDTVNSKTVSNPNPPSVNSFMNFFNGLDDLSSDITDWLNTFIPTAFTDIPVSQLQKFVFPGGKTFSFKTISFSDNQDLIAQIKYTDPA